MKKTTLTIIVLFFLVFSLSACQSSDSVTGETETERDEEMNQSDEEEASILEGEHESTEEAEPLTIEDSQWLLGLAEDTFQKLKNHQFESLADVTHPSKNLTFVALADSATTDVYETVFTGEQFTKYKKRDKYMWGYDQEGLEINLNLNDYVSQYLFKDHNEDDIDYREVLFHQIEKEEGRIEQLIKAHPRAVLIDYATTELESDEQKLRFMFEKEEEQWYLFAIIREESL
ncbi:hypothetical protein AJ85_01335 [Alkalihalobacillus alcalophilus ATCC 27647 = CGMCC 1.3604]|uniref:Lipoprotein n=1 Tax=Alkalihalobacillus alcalophilus ATCC 27647 = CGMCC 1.3604 TaxID=1218173 RepID=A0A094WLY4_ALKAL|nr:hypothetical protein [Alkalihalobacillus alcalophilus]KGA97861.1 hypothetical protein BALCAV_0207425 [Alkalihalobacillus alcalophilus ATCC 27647 = CGMCC 1.3604]MED1562106.1 hypothetical protein [Alkalihalobacillus alcalophilus]THG88673.1 hypothetical protein AJ85_01335 [Alkalihalobacillus alcalophilus ATCC 27647 = CGMCC 1.3604]